MEKPKQMYNGRPHCNLQIKYMLDCAGGSMTRFDIRQELIKMGYSYYGIYEAFRRLENKGEIQYKGSSHAPKSQLVYLVSKETGEETNSNQG